MFKWLLPTRRIITNLYSSWKPFSSMFKVWFKLSIQSYAMILPFSTQNRYTGSANSQAQFWAECRPGIWVQKEMSQNQRVGKNTKTLLWNFFDVRNILWQSIKLDQFWPISQISLVIYELHFWKIVIFQISKIGLATLKSIITARIKV